MSRRPQWDGSHLISCHIKLKWSIFITVARRLSNTWIFLLSSEPEHCSHPTVSAHLTALVFLLNPDNSVFKFVCLLSDPRLDRDYALAVAPFSSVSTPPAARLIHACACVWNVVTVMNDFSVMRAGVVFWILHENTPSGHRALAVSSRSYLALMSFEKGPTLHHDLHVE